MKKIILALLVMVIMVGCSLEPEFDVDAWIEDFESDYNPITLEEAAEYWVDLYGIPEDIDTYLSSGFGSSTYRWYSQGVFITFENTIYDDVTGWRYESKYTFTPF